MWDQPTSQGGQVGTRWLIDRKAKKRPCGINNFGGGGGGEIAYSLNKQAQLP